ncbi:unnamed protein product [Pedinophyceae sp. YPF-701]|nr:unnamed protein product [Pedinophyceae sp. YPF-701]
MFAQSVAKSAPCASAAPARAPLARRAPALAQRPRRAARTAQALPIGAIEIDWSDPDTWLGVGGAVLGLLIGIGAPILYIRASERDEERLEELRALNRATKEATGEYLTDEEIAEIRTPKWTDRREFVDND